MDRRRRIFRAVPFPSKWIAMVSLAGPLIWGCGDPAPPPSGADPATVLAAQEGNGRASKEGGPFVPNLLQQLSASSEQIAQTVRPSVVRVKSSDIRLDGGADRPLDALYGHVSESRLQPVLATGTIVGEQGWILTNHHVIRGAQQIEVVMPDNTSYVARIAGTDLLTDLALLKIDANELPAIEWGDSDKLGVGALVWSIGSPYVGLEASVSLGIVSAKERQGLASSLYQQMLQTDVVTNRGNSGGPLIDVDGKVVGINTSIVGEGFHGISMAIPSNDARDVAERLMRDGRIDRGWLGVEVEPVPPRRAVELAITVLPGVMIRSMEGLSPARQAGLQSGDVILKWNSSDVPDANLFRRLVASSPIGARVPVQILRDSPEPQTIEVVVGKQP